MIHHFYNATYITVIIYGIKKIAVISGETFISVIFRGTNANLKFALSLILCEKIKLKSLVISNKE